MILLLINAASPLLPVGPNRLPLSSERHTRHTNADPLIHTHELCQYRFAD